MDWTSYLIGTDMPGYDGIFIVDMTDDDKPDVIKVVSDQNKVILF